ncbi:MAG: SulP family inorganic anion transporter [Pseudomonadota bacterium]
MRRTDPPVRGRLPILQGVLPIVPSRIPAEILAGVTFACLAIPEVMGYTKIVGTPVVTGLYTLLIPMTLFAIFGASRHLVVGADSATAAMTASALAVMSVSGTSEYLALASLLALMSAALLIAARLVGLGFLADFLSRTVLVGFLTGVGIQVALGEVPGLFGIATTGHGTLEKLSSAVQNIEGVNWPTFAVSAAVLIVVLGAKRVSRKVPGPLIAVIGAILASWALDFEARGIGVLGPVPGGLPSLSIPTPVWDWDTIRQLLPTALAIFVVILAQSAATSRAYASRYGEGFSENTDLIGLGLANLGAGLSGTFVVNGSPTKTEMVSGAGGHSQLAQLTTAGVVLIVLLFLTGPLAFLPGAVLSSVVFLIGLNLIDIQGLIRVYHQARTEFWIAVVTAGVVVAIGVEQGILVAMAMSLIDHTRKGYRPKNAVVVQAPDGEWLTKTVDRAAAFLPGLVVYRFSHGLYYANATQLATEVASLVASIDPSPRWICFDASAIDDIDYTAGAVLTSTIKDLQSQGIEIAFLFVDDTVRKELDRYGIIDLVGPEALFESARDMMTAVQTVRS